jgi:cytosine/uracil/thiamine/allantoin permease
MKPNERKLKMNENRSIAAFFSLAFMLIALSCFAFAAVAFPFGSTESLMMLCLAVGNVFVAVSASLASH